MIERFPEIYRYAKAETKPKRLLLVGTTVSILALCLLSTGWASGSTETLETCLRVLIGLQFFAFMAYGASCTGDSIIAERQARTWDFQRLTPQTGLQICLGKFIGSSLLALFMALVFFFWTVVGWLTMAEDWRDGFFKVQLHFAGMSFLALSVGMLTSAYSPPGRGGIIGRLAGAAGAILFFVNIAALISTRSHLRPVEGEFFNMMLAPKNVMLINAVAFGVWALAASAWRIGGELLEPRRLWRMPAFMTFLVWITYETSLYFARVTTASFSDAFRMSTVLGCAALYLAALFGPNLLEEFKTLWQKRRLSLLPPWLVGLIALAVNLVIMDLVAWKWMKVPDLPQPLSTAGSTLLVLFCFRDCLFIQWARLSRMRRPEIASVVFLSISYFTPALMLAILRLDKYHYVFTPRITAYEGAVIHLVPVVLQILLVAAILAYRLHTLLRPARSAPAN